MRKKQVIAIVIVCVVVALGNTACDSIVAPESESDNGESNGEYDENSNEDGEGFDGLDLARGSIREIDLLVDRWTEENTRRNLLPVFSYPEGFESMQLAKDVEKNGVVFSVFLTLFDEFETTNGYDGSFGDPGSEGFQGFSATEVALLSPDEIAGDSFEVPDEAGLPAAILWIMREFDAQVIEDELRRTAERWFTPIDADIFEVTVHKYDEDSYSVTMDAVLQVESFSQDDFSNMEDDDKLPYDSEDFEVADEKDLAIRLSTIELQIDYFTDVRETD